MLTDDLWRNNGVLLRVYMYLAANSTDGKITTSTAQISRATKLTERQVRDALTELERSNKTSNKTSNKGSDITLCGIGGCANSTSSKRSNKTSSKRSNPKEVEKPGHDYVSPPFVAPEYADTWRMFIQYRKEINKPYKSEASERTAYNKMVEMSGDNPETAKDMVERTILGQWQGLFPKDNGTKQSNNTTVRYASEREANRQRVDRGLRAAMDVIARENGF